jgi:hypothetical protein
MKLRYFTLTLKSEEDEESEVILFLRRSLDMIEKAEMIVGAYVRNMPTEYVHLTTREEILRRE